MLYVVRLFFDPVEDMLLIDSTSDSVGCSSTCVELELLRFIVGEGELRMNDIDDRFEYVCWWSLLSVVVVGKLKLKFVRYWAEL